MSHKPDGPAKAAAMLNARLAYTLDAGTQRGAVVGNLLFDILNAVRNAGSITHAARELDYSYRHVWGTLRQWEATLGQALILGSRGQHARLTPYAERLLWAERRARVRMQPHIEALRADLSRVLSEAGDDSQQLLSVHASHDLALPLLQRHATDTAGLHLDLRFQGSVDCLRALNAGQCLVAGFHVPALQGAAPLFAAAIKPLLKPGLHKLIGCSRRTQGLMVRKEHTGKICTLADLTLEPLRFVNRQVGSGTRLLMDQLMQQEQLDPASVRGYFDNVEETHVAVAACVASGQADAGLGIEAAALEFGLHFIPRVEEDYFLACLKPNLEHPAVVRLRRILADPTWHQILSTLPGYAPVAAPGKVLVMTSALPWWRFTQSKRAEGKQAVTVA